MNPRLRTALIVLALFAAAWLPRVMGLDEFVTIDERKWLARSGNFTYALAHGDLADTFQREHPGVTVMWAGTLGLLNRFPDYAQQAPGQFAWDREYLESWLIENTDHTPLELLVAGRWWIVLGVALAIAAGFFPLRALFGERLAIFGALYIAWTPFYIALSRQLHPDGTVASLTYLALLCYLAWLYAGLKWRYLIASGVVMGLAWLTKTPAIFLVPTGALLLIVEIFRRQPDDPSEARPARSRYLIGFVVWGAVATALFVILWPAMWLSPLGTLGRMAAEMGDYVQRHVNPNYFLGSVTDDPGLIFYPIAYLFRTTPLTLAGLVLVGVFAWRRERPLLQSAPRRAAFGLALFALLFVAGMSLGAKKFDRYILPSFLALDTLAVLGWAGAAYWLTGRRQARSGGGARWWAPALMGAVLLLHGLLGFVHYPYYLTYYNPLTGGARTAPQVLFVGWGEGLDAAAEWLNEQPDAEQSRAVAWYHDGPFSYFYDGQAAGLSYGSPLFWLDMDYAVVYVNQWQRGIPSTQAVDYFQSLEPVHSVRFRGLDLAHVYDMRGTLLPDFIDIGQGSAADFGDRIRLAGYRLDEAQVEAGDRIQGTFYLQSLAPMDANYNVLLRLVGADGSELWRAEGWPWGAPTADWPLREIRPDGHEIEIPADAAPGLYKLSLGFYDPESLDSLPVEAVGSDVWLDDVARDVALIQVGSDAASGAGGEAPWQFDRYFALSEPDLPATVVPGEELTLKLLWETLQAAPADYTTFVHVVNGAGELVAQQDRPPLAGFAPTHTWAPGQLLEDEYQLPLPADLPDGVYEIRLGLYAKDGSRLPVARGGEPDGDYAAIGSVTVAP